MAAGKLGFAIDRGGTFTDVFVSRADGTTRVLKLLSEDPGNYSDAPTEAIRRVLEEEFGKPIPRSTPIDTSNISWIRMGTTVATNALLERKGERIALVITKGFANLLDIGNQSRPKIFDLKIQMPSVLYDRIVEVDERVVLGQSDCELEDSSERVTATTGDELRVWQKVNIDKLRSDLQNTFNEGIRSLAVILLHSYMYPQHELEMGRLASEIGFTNISLSSQIMPMIKAVPRGFTACADAYLTPVINTYVDSFCSGFRDNLMGVPVLFMQSDGGLCPVHKFYGSRAILSGPAGGVVGISVTSFNPKTKQPVIGFDMGGTSTDVSRYAGEFSHVFETTTAGVTIQAPQLDINTVAAGGGSRLFFRSGLFVVGPESAGANPGPVCYRKGGYLTITDANLILGRIIPDFFPKIFGPNEDEPLDEEATLQAFQQLTKEANEFIQSSGVSKQPMSVQEVALGFIDVANEAMCRPIRNLTQAKGYDTAQHILSCFGGAGGQHACAIAKVLGMKSVFVHKYSGILSAYGLALADVVAEAQEPCHMPYVKDNFALFDSKLKELIAKCRSDLVQQGFNEHHISVETFLNMRYDRTDCAIMCHPINPHSSELGDFLTSFQESYQREFGFVIKDRQIIVDDIRVRGVAQIGIREKLKVSKSAGPAIPHSTRKCYFKGGFRETKLHLWSELQAGHSVVGPAIIIEKNSTVLVEPDCTATVTDEGDLMIEVASESQKGIDTKVDPIQLSIFSHRFMSIAEQMGRILQRTSISTNIKERLDFSCALFGPDGGLIANAPHIPVHLGSMQETVRFQLQLLGDKISDGDVYLSNHPMAGGSHLPDLTVITPVFYRNSTNPVFFVAARGHHADIGGLVPGSMPPHSTSLADEGATFVSLKLVDKGRFMEEAVTEALMAPGKIPGCSGTRNLSDNLSDLRAQIAANRKGMLLVCELIDAYGLHVVQAYMAHIQANAEVAVRDLLKEVAVETQKVTGTCKLSAVDHMDDGTPIQLSVSIDKLKGEATFDFSGTGWEVWGNCNTPRAVVYAAVIYCLRCLVGHDIPLNQGCLNPVKVLIPANSILSPSPQAAVVGGNVLTSQRLVDVIFKAFQSCAASQGCMNNITFGNDRLGYYETVAGGAGAGPTWHGVSGVHTHMTNTRITDVEILERRYPIILRNFGLRSNSGGRGQFSGGNGVIRAYLFRTSLTLSVLTERRVFAPYGLHGGQPGSKGLNVMRFADGRVVNLGSKKSIQVHPGDLFILQTPGGGGWGKLDDSNTEEPEKNDEYSLPFGPNVVADPL